MNAIEKEWRDKQRFLSRVATSAPMPYGWRTDKLSGKKGWRSSQLENTKGAMLLRPFRGEGNDRENRYNSDGAWARVRGADNVRKFHAQSMTPESKFTRGIATLGRKEGGK